MFRFLRKFRRTQLERHEFGRYLKYAAGEILLVVFGILIALQIDSWNDNRLDRLQEQEYLISMLNDLAVDRQRIDEAVTGNALLLDGLERLLQLLGGPNDEFRSDPARVREAFMHALVYTYWYMRVDFSELTMSQLKSSGSLLLITNKQVRDAMITYEQGLEACRHQDDEMQHYFHVVEENQKRLFNMRYGKRSFEYIEEDYHHMLDPLENFSPLVPPGQYLADDDPLLLNRYYSDLMFYRTALNVANMLFEEQKQLGESLARLIRDSYGLN